MRTNPRSVVLRAVVLTAALWLAVLLAEWTRFDRTPLVIGLLAGAAVLLTAAAVRGRRRST